MALIQNCPYCGENTVGDHPECRAVHLESLLAHVQVFLKGRTDSIPDEARSAILREKLSISAPDDLRKRRFELFTQQLEERNIQMLLAMRLKEACK
jgi:hypothetical protein